MAKRYSKLNSNYILRKKHQETNKGTIWERDWVTIGAQHQIEPGKRPFYSDGNFLYTDNAVAPPSKRLKVSKKIGEWKYDDVKDAKPLVNQVVVNNSSCDFRDYAYYGSAVEMVRAAISNIITWFPGMAVTEDVPPALPATVFVLIKACEKIESFNDNVNRFGEELCQVNSGYYIRTEYLTTNEDDSYGAFGRNVNIKDGDSYRYVNSSVEETLYYYNLDVVEGGDKVFLSVEGWEELNEEKSEKYTYKTIYNYKNDGIIDARGDAEQDITWVNEEGMTLSNPFGIDFFHTNIEEKYSTNKLRFMVESYRSYQINDEDIVSYKVSRWMGEKTCPINDIYKNVVNISIGTPLFYIHETRLMTKDAYSKLEEARQELYTQFYEDYYILNSFVYDESELNKEEDYYPFVDGNGETKYINKAITADGETYRSLTDTDKLSVISFGVSEDTYIIHGYRVDNNMIVYVVVAQPEDVSDVIIKPKNELIEQYFDDLEGFEKVLLNRETNPIYQISINTPEETENGVNFYEKTYTWPSNGYCIDIQSSNYSTYVSELIDVAQYYDDNWTDNIWRSMTHESIKNFDWTYTREYTDGDEEDYAEGGNRMEQLIRVYGRLFDDLKRHIDGIKLTNIVTYNKRNNMPDAELSDKLTFQGWDIFSTIPSFTETVENEEDVEEVTEDLSTTYLTREFIERHCWKPNDTNHDMWFPTLTPEEFTASDMDIQFNRELTLASKRIFSSKGTVESIEMVMALFGLGENDYSITEKYYFTFPKESTSSLRSLIAFINGYEDYDDDSDVDIFSNIPMDEIELYHKKLIVPFYDKSKSYYSDFIFQDKGGWGKDGKSLMVESLRNFEIDDSSTETKTYMETLSYLKIVPNVEALTSENPFSVTEGDIYYVSNITYLSVEDDTLETQYPSHFFVCINSYNVDDFDEGWRCIDISDETDEYTATAKYLDSIIPTQIGNNPHVGYGKYDLGDTYISNLKDPFRALFSLYTNNDDPEMFNNRRRSSSDVVFDFAEMETNETDTKIKNLISNMYLDEGKLFVKLYQDIANIEERLKNATLQDMAGDENYYYDETFGVYYLRSTVKFGNCTSNDSYIPMIDVTEGTKDTIYEKLYVYCAEDDAVEEMSIKDDGYYYDEWDNKYEKEVDTGVYNEHFYGDVELYKKIPDDSEEEEFYRIKCNVDGLYYHVINKSTFDENCSLDSYITGEYNDDYVEEESEEETFDCDNYFYYGPYFETIDSSSILDDMNSRTEKYEILHKLYDQLVSKYYINSKVIILSNKQDNEYFKKYFINVISKYVMQVIPSTSILVLDGFYPS